MRIREMSRGLRAVIRSLICSLAQFWLLVVETPAVFATMAAFRTRRAELDHPWVTGEFEGEEIWPRNIVYRSKSRLPATTEASDAQIVSSIGRFLRSMVRRSTTAEEIPQGSRRRMPHGVNVIHGAVHYNGVFMVFDDFADLVSHMTDRRFRRDILRFGRQQRREITLVFRNRKYDPVHYAYTVGCVRAHLPWFSNGNGPTKKPVLWGNMSPYPAINLINGAWMRDMWRMRVNPAAAARPPVDGDHAFADEYFGTRSRFTFWDRWKAYVMFNDVRSRGFRGQLFFTNRTKIEPHRLGEYREAGGFWRWTACHEVPVPWKHAEEAQPGASSISVIIPTLNEAGALGRCLTAVSEQLSPFEIVVADGGSSDVTVDIARRYGAKVVTSSGGRGGQCKAGAAVASGDVLVFLHADASLGSGAREAALAALQRTEVATFSQRTRSPRRRYRFLDWLTRLDTPFTRFGDQGLIMRRSTYEQLGGMPEMKLFEDVQLLRRARRRGPIGRAKARIYVSPRQYEKLGVRRKIWRDAGLIRRYYKGVPADVLYREYYS